MTSMNVSLPEALKRFVEEQVDQGGYSTPSEYVRSLIREAQARAEQRELETKLLAGLESPAREMTPGEWSALKQRVLGRRGQQGDE